jgi:hypothetical protein
VELSVGLDIVAAATLVFGLVFAIVQLRQYRASRARELGLELLRSFQTPEFASALRAVFAASGRADQSRDRGAPGSEDG